MCLGAVVQGRGKWVAGGGQLGLRVRSSWALLLDASQVAAQRCLSPCKHAVLLPRRL